MGLFSFDSPEDILATRIIKATSLNETLPEFSKKSSLEDLRVIQKARKEIEDATTQMYRYIPLEDCQHLFYSVIEMYKRIGDWGNAERKAAELVEYSRNCLKNDEIDINLRIDAITQEAQAHYSSDNYFANEFIKKQDELLRDIGKYMNDAPQFTFIGSGANELMLKYLAIALSRYDDICKHNGKLQKAALIAEQSLRIRIELSDPQFVATGLINLGHYYLNTGKIDDATALYEKALEIQQGSITIQEEVYQENIGATSAIAVAMDNLSIAYANNNNPQKAKELLLKALTAREILYGPNDPDVGYTLIKLSDIAQQTKSLKEAEDYALRGLEILRMNYGDEHPRTLSAYVSLGKIYSNDDRLVEAADCYLRSLRFFEESRTISIDTIALLEALTEIYKKQESLDELIEKYEHFITIAQTSNCDPYFLISLLSKIAGLYKIQGRHDIAYSTAMTARQIVLNSFDSLLDGTAITFTYSTINELLAEDDDKLILFLIQELELLLETKPASITPLLAFFEPPLIFITIQQTVEQARSVGYPYDPSVLKKLFEGSLEGTQYVFDNLQEILDVLRKYFYRSEKAFLAWVLTCFIGRITRNGIRDKMSGTMSKVAEFSDELGTATLAAVAQALRELETAYMETLDDNGDLSVVEVTKLSLATTNQVRLAWDTWLKRPRESSVNQTKIRESHDSIIARNKKLESVEVQLNDEQILSFTFPDVDEIIAQIDKKIRYKTIDVSEFKAYCRLTYGEPERVEEIFRLLDGRGDINYKSLALELLDIRQQYLGQNSIRYATTLCYVSRLCYDSGDLTEDTLSLLEEACIKIANLKNRLDELAQFNLEKAVELAEHLKLYDRVISNLDKILILYEKDTSLPFAYYAHGAISKKFEILTKQERFRDLMALVKEAERLIRRSGELRYFSSLIKWRISFAKPLADFIHREYRLLGTILVCIPFRIRSIYFRVVYIHWWITSRINSLIYTFRRVKRFLFP